MDLPEFLAKLAKTPRDWRVTASSHSLRRHDSGRELLPQCPITAVAGEQMLDDWRDAAARLGLDAGLASEIAGAADDYRSCAATRAALLNACSLPVTP